MAGNPSDTNHGVAEGRPPLCERHLMFAVEYVLAHLAGFLRVPAVGKLEVWR